MWVVNHELSKTQDYWEKQRRFQKHEQYLDKKMNLLEKINEKILKLEVSAFRIKNDSTSLAIEASFNQSEYDAHYGRIVTYHYELAELGSLMQVAAIFFSNETSNILLELSEALKNNYANKKSFIEMKQKYNKIHLKGNTSKLKNEINKDMSFELESNDLMEKRHKALKAMISEIKQAHDVYMQK